VKGKEGVAGVFSDATPSVNRVEDCTYNTKVPHPKKKGGRCTETWQQLEITNHKSQLN
jgi:hypothetical protein